MSSDAAVPAHVAAALAAAAVPSGVIDRLSSAVPAPAPGQIWRARWEGVALLVLITLVGDEVVGAVPVDFDDELAMDSDRVLPAEATTLQVRCSALAHLRRSMPRFVFDECVAHLSGPPGSQMSAQLTDFDTGEPLLGALDERVRELAKVEDDMTVLSRAAWVVEGSGTLGALLNAAAADVEAIAELLHCSVQRALSLTRGGRGVSRAQAQTLAAAYALNTDDLLAANPALPKELVAAVNAPESRTRLDRLGRQSGLGDAQVRRLFAGDAFALAARQTGSASKPDWRQRLDQVLDAALVMADGADVGGGARP